VDFKVRQASVQEFGHLKGFVTGHSVTVVAQGCHFGGGEQVQREIAGQQGRRSCLLMVLGSKRGVTLPPTMLLGGTGGGLAACLCMGT